MSKPPAAILTVVIHFPSPGHSRDGQAHYLAQIVPALAKQSAAHVHIVALRFGDQVAHEEGVGWSVQRVEPTVPMADVFAAYLPAHFAAAVTALCAGAVERARALGPETPVWCHGYETGAAVQTLAGAGHRVVGVVHYLVGIETLHDLAVGDDTVRRAAFDSALANRVGRAIPKRARPLTVRWAARLAAPISPVIARLPLPGAIQTQFQKLDQERRFVAHCTELVAVGPGFERAMNALYPCTLGRSRAVIAGAPPHPLPPPEWPLAHNPEARRVVAVGRPTGQKGWDYLSSALARLVAERPELAAQIELVILGGLGEWDGPFSDYSRRVSEAMGDLAPIKIANLGVVPHAQVLAYMRAAHLLIHPATFEPLGLVLLEAMAAGCGIIAGDAEGPSDLLRPPWGRLVAFGDPAQRVENLYTALNDWLVLSPAQITEQGAAAEVAARAYTWPACAAGHWAALSGG